MVLSAADDEILNPDPTTANDGPAMRISGLVLIWESVMLFPATRLNPVEDAVFAVPSVIPLATKLNCVLKISPIAIWVSTD